MKATIQPINYKGCMVYKDLQRNFFPTKGFTKKNGNI